jgi:uncharacterized membrane protein YesL
MNQLFHLDNPVFKFIEKFWECIFLSILWCVFSIPILTIGASTTALYYTAYKNIRKGKEHVWSCFWSSFKTNFKQSTAFWFILLATGVIFYMDYRMLGQLKNNTIGLLNVMFLVMLVLESAYAVYVFSYLARISDSLRATTKKSMLLAFSHPMITLMIMILNIISIFLIWLSPLLVSIIPALHMLATGFFMERIYSKYLPAGGDHAEKAS